MPEYHPRPRSLPWLERLAMRLPGYGGYQERGHRREAERILLDAIAARLRVARDQIDTAIRQCIEREALSEINSLERIRQHIDRVADRLRLAEAGTDHFYNVEHLGPDKTDPLHVVDLELFETVEALAHRFEQPDLDHNRLAHIEEDLRKLEIKLDQRALMLQGIG
ncbi:MAG: hypothetical protein IRY99_18995 [Isosphaeraceae bacterium]|nr:hypothetical protein [Isosphaeraceae bacterium]